MANPIWPPALPPDVLTEGLQETWGNNVIRTAMEIGPAKHRRRATAEVRPIDVTIEFLRDDVAVFDDWFTDELAGGVLPFDWTHPRTGATVTFRFIPPFPVAPQRGAKFWRAMCKLEILP